MLKKPAAAGIAMPQVRLKEVEPSLGSRGTVAATARGRLQDGATIAGSIARGYGVIAYQARASLPTVPASPSGGACSCPRGEDAAARRSTLQVVPA